MTIMGRCTNDQPCLQSECDDCSHIRVFRGLLYGFALMFTALAVFVAFGWFSYEVYQLWEANHGM
jgi:hypothetical protein